MKVKKYPYPKKGVLVKMKKSISLILIVVLMFQLAACHATDNLHEVPTDAERIVVLAQAEENNPDQPAALTPTPAPEVTKEHYTFSTTAVEGRLSVSVPAAVFLART